jgi:cystathionine beta-lyase
MKYNFDEIIDRHNTNCVKIEQCEEIFGTKDLIPLWIADMDFKTPDFVFEAIDKRNEHPILGYSLIPEKFNSTFKSWVKKQHNWDIEKEWLGFLSGIVPGLAFSVQIYSNPGDDVIIQTPVYPPFSRVVTNNGRSLVSNPVKVVDGRFEMDFEDLERKITPKTKMLILCNPHNPGGKMWEPETLKKLASICSKNKIVVISDEIHADMGLWGKKHTPFASVSEEAAEISITFMAPSKSFNIPGVLTSVFIISNPVLRRKFNAFLMRNEIMHGSIYAYASTIAAYEKGNEWRKQMIEYIQNNIEFVMTFFESNIPQIKVMKPEASFLIWLNCEGLGLKPEEIPEFFIKKAKLGLNDGRTFGEGGENCMRLNVACPKSILEKALKQLKMALSEL